VLDKKLIELVSHRVILRFLRCVCHYGVKKVHLYID
jgi:hypothetical protein